MKALLKSNKKKAVQALTHPKDRKVDQFQRELRRNVRLEGQKETLNSKQAIVNTRFFWFREQVAAICGVEKIKFFTVDEAAALTQLNIDRNDIEVDSLKKLRNPPTGRIKHLLALKQMEQDQFNSVKGITIPNILTEDGVDVLLRIWDADPRTITCVPTTEISVRGANVSEARQRFHTILKPTDEVRDAQLENHAPSRLKRFAAEGKSSIKDRNNRAKSVKSIASSSDVATKGKQRRVLQQQARTKSRRQAAVAASRGLV